jgi:predicted RNA-binding protein associated with RNAse of E/G family
MNVPSVFLRIDCPELGDAVKAGRITIQDAETVLADAARNVTEALERYPAHRFAFAVVPMKPWNLL